MTVPQVPAVLLHRIEQELDAEERETMQYLCRDLVPDVPAAETRKLFVALNEREILTLSTLSELLYRLKRFDLLRKVLGTGRAAVEASLSQFPPLIPKYRVLMAEISKELDEEDLHSFMFLMMNDTSYGKTAKEKTFLTIITDLENLDLVSPSRLDFLEDCFLHMRRRDLVKRIQKFKQEACVPFLSPEHPIGTSSVCANRLQASFPELSIADPPAVSLNEPNALKWLSSNAFRRKDGVLNKYRMRSKPLGVCLIIDCIGNDTMELESVFKWLGFEVKKYDDKTSDELLKLLKDWQSSEYWKDSDCLVCCILSHGESGKIYATDGCLISINKITSFFTAKQCALLAKKPKLFFIQACQGSKLHQPVYLEADNHETCSPGADAQTSGFIPTQQQMTSSIPEEADFLLGMATVDGYYSYRDVQRGTWFIQVLCEKLRELHLFGHLSGPPQVPAHKRPTPSPLYLQNSLLKYIVCSTAEARSPTSVTLRPLKSL
uniref:CASP8 and FADD like apoptosis regulator n=1 Tax=Podarcis muralis TaxID=64176 RepID=A0A670HWS2_PODMU